MWSAIKIRTASGLGSLLYLSIASSLSSVRSAAEHRLHAAHEEHLKRSHQRRSAGAVQNFGQVGLRQIEFEQAEVPHLRGYKMFQDGFAAAATEEDLVSNKHIDRPQLVRLHLGDEAIGLGEGPHQKPSRMFETRVRANSRERRSSAGELSSKKLESSRVTWYCSRNT